MSRSESLALTIQTAAAALLSIIEFDEREMPVSRITDFLRELPGASQAMAVGSAL